MKPERRETGVGASGDPGTLVPVGSVEPAAAVSGEDKSVGVTC
jgi:hypothetical protein